MNINDFNYDLPEELIALKPLESRTTSRLLHINSNSEISHNIFTDILNLINENDVLVFNNTKVIKARIKGSVEGKDVEVTLLKHLSEENGNKWQILAKPGKHFKVGKMFHVEHILEANILDKGDDGIITLDFNCTKTELFEVLNNKGSMPLPPYIEKKRKADDSDESTYQTVYAKKQGAVAAPTAGLHFNDDIIAELKAKGVNVAEVTLHVGAGTFLPVRVDDVKAHKMHSEYFEIDEENAQIINSTKKAGGRVICVGTTSLRTLESSNSGGLVVPNCGETEIFIYPGYEFQMTDCLITNFHLPKSTLFILISAFIGLEQAKDFYKKAVEKKYRFFSYGDSCFMEKLGKVAS